MKIRRVFPLIVLVLLLALGANAVGEGIPRPFLRFDLDSPDAWNGPLSGVRFLTEGAWSFTPIDSAKCEKYGISPDTVPSAEGLDTLNISGSAEFSEEQFHKLAGDLKTLAGDKQIWIVDCRLESHALVNGIAMSWYADRNWANKGLTLAEAEADEAARFSALPGTTVTVYTAENNVPENPQEIMVERWMTEREMVEEEGFHYLRLPGNDHSWPEEEAVETFLAFRVPGMAQFLRVKVPPRVVTAKCSEPQAAVSNDRRGGSGVAKPRSLR
ncbi:MAG: hypothetical protein IKP22_08725, partial [Clostridia bacterium]|nr:hypothetical protein [Clostridia bacterium]